MTDDQASNTHTESGAEAQMDKFGAKAGALMRVSPVGLFVLAAALVILGWLLGVPNRFEMSKFVSFLSSLGGLISSLGMLVAYWSVGRLIADALSRKG